LPSEHELRSGRPSGAYFLFQEQPESVSVLTPWKCAVKFFLRVLNCDVAVRCADKSAVSLLRECYSAFLIPGDARSRPALSYDVSLISHAGGWMLSCGETAIFCHDSYDLLYEFEKDMTERLQRLRADLFFVHGAALSVAERCVIISGESGSGKSSLAWCLGHSGFEYLSDELAPIDPSTLAVEPYPHALCLKTEPLCAPALPDSTQYTTASKHIPAYELPTRALDQSCPLSFLVFIDKVLDGRDMVVRGIGNAESAARLYSNGLNQLSHPGEGLPIVAAITSTMPSYLVSGGTVERRAQAVRDLFDSTAPGRIAH
jgi:hypothetical protein